MKNRLFRPLVCFLLVLCGTAHATEQQSDIPRFPISRFQVEGNSLLPQESIDRLLTPFAGESRDFGDVQRALEALEAAYRERGYSLVQVALPEQELNGGVVRLQVVETRIGRVIVEGNQHFDEANIRNSLPALREGESPNIDQVSTSLRLANENPAKKVTLQLRSGARDGETDAVVKVKDEKPWEVGMSLANTGNSATGKTQLGVLFRHANVAGLDHVASLQYITSVEKPNQVSVYGAGYHIPLYQLGDSIDLFASYSDVNSAFVLAGITDLQVSGRGTVLGARYNQNMRRVGNYESRLIYGVDYKAYKNGLALGGGPAQAVGDVTVRPLSVGYAGTWGLNQAEFAFNVSALHNLPGGDKGGSADFQAARTGASSNYGILRYGASYGRALPQDWQMRFNFAGQYTRDALVPGEQFGAGGAASVRGFQERELSNDSGHVFNAELYTPNLCAGMQSVAAQCRALAFYDAARVSRNNALPGEVEDASIASVGLGLRVAIDRNMALQLDAGRVVDAGINSGKGDIRLHVRLTLSY
jgi:hemolysin activation/secretion protein